jgi:hypothetical protein
MQNVAIEDVLRELLVLMGTPPQERSLGKGFCKIPSGSSALEIAIDPRSNYGWQYDDGSGGAWPSLDEECFEATLINYQIRDITPKPEKLAKINDAIAELEDDIAAARDPNRRERKQIDLEKKHSELIDCHHYVYLYFKDRERSYKLRMKPTNNFTMSLFNQLSVLTSSSPNKLKSPIKVAPEMRASSRDSERKVTFAKVFVGDNPVWVGEKNQITSREWAKVWRQRVEQVGNTIRKLHDTQQPYNSQASLPAYEEDDSDRSQLALPHGEDAIEADFEEVEDPKTLLNEKVIARAKALWGDNFKDKIREYSATHFNGLYLRDMTATQLQKYLEDLEDVKTQQKRVA